jgi:RNA recognition motif-containing protein
MECRRNIYIGNMSFETTEEQVRLAFEGFGAVSTVRISTDRGTGRPKGFGFVELLHRRGSMV